MKGTLAIAFIAILCLSMFSAFAPKVNAQQSSADWPMFHADPSHSGAGTGNPVLTPTLLWNYTTSGYVESSPAVVGGVVYVGGGNNVYALNAANGAKLWSYKTDSAVDSCPAVINGVVYVGSEGGKVYALNAANGAKLWSYITGGYIVYSSPAIVNGVVFIGSYDDNVYALNATSGIQLWKYTTGSSVFSSPAVVDGLVYIGSDDSNVYALNATSGTQLWNYTTGSTVESSPAAVNGVIYIGSDNGNVYAFGALPASSNTSSIIIGVAVAAVIVATAVFLMFRKRLKTKPTSPPYKSTDYTTELCFSFLCSNIAKIARRAAFSCSLLVMAFQAQKPQKK